MRSPEYEKTAASTTSPAAFEMSSLARNDRGEHTKDRPKWASQNAWQARNLEKRRAHVAVSRAIRSGKLTRPTLCEKCGEEKRLDAHHSSYAGSDILAVSWWCRRCHAGHHARLRKQGGVA